MEREGIVLLDEGLSGSIRFEHFRAPGKRYHKRRNGFVGSLVVTRQRFAAFAFSKPVVNVPLDRKHLGLLQCRVESGDRLVVRFDVAAFHPGWSGVVECHFRTPLASRFLAQLHAAGNRPLSEPTSEPGASALLFHEEQRPNRLWSWGTSGLLLACLAWVANGFYRQLVLGEPWGNKPAPDDVFVYLMIGILLFTLGVSALLLTLKLTIEVRRDGLFVQLFPIHLRKPKRIPLERMTVCEAVRYRPIRDYGGWGIRYSRLGNAYNLRGDRGVRISFADRKPLLIGSQRPEELAAAIKAIRGPTPNGGCAHAGWADSHG